MITTLIVFNLSGRRRSSTNGKKSYQCKFVFYTLNTTALLISAYFFVRHNTYCESGVYTMFAICEYIVVLTNIAFHSTAAIDFRDKVLVMTSESNLGFKHH
uniref:Post-GPI attachment to proteins factor 2 n=1 Tax=Romanomermis culicivorax TaxID=13658 RepID=A0A915L2M8_ROMCU